MRRIGRAPRQHLLRPIETVVEGSGDERMLQIRVKPCESICGAGKIEVTVDLIRLRAISAAGAGNSGDVEDTGAAVVTQRVAGRGSVRQRP